MYYNADLLDIVQQKENTMSLDFIDDIVYGVKRFSDKENVCRFNDILQETENWRRKYGAQFETSKYILVHYT